MRKAAGRLAGIRVVLALTGALALLLGLAAPAAAHALDPRMSGMGGQIRVVEPPGAHPMDPLQVTVSVSYKGLNEQKGLEIEAVVGQVVEITFVWADDAVPDNAHRLLLRGYELRTALIDSENREQTLSFVADRNGTFELVCDWRCEGHKEALQSARLVVRDPHAGMGPATLAAPNLVLARVAAPPAGAAAPEGATEPVTISATMSDPLGQPIAGAPVRFSLWTAFGGVESDMEIGERFTDERGVAGLVYVPTTVGEHEFVARFAGSDILAPGEQRLRITVERAVGVYVVAPRGLDLVARYAPPAIALVVLGIWSTFAYVLYQVVRIRAGRPSAGRAP